MKRKKEVIHMSTKKRILKTPTSIGKLENDLKNAENLLDAWEKDPAGIFVRYGIAPNKEDVKVKQVQGWCACGCTPSGYEFEFETSGYAPAAFETFD
jgi:hypothetical protein